LFTNQIASGTTAELLLSKRKNQFLCHIANSTAYHTQDYTTPTALVVGTEATG
jgi:TrmH family RNA methyltransferase